MKVKKQTNSRNYQLNKPTLPNLGRESVFNVRDPVPSKYIFNINFYHHLHALAN